MNGFYDVDTGTDLECQPCPCIATTAYKYGTSSCLKHGHKCSDIVSTALLVSQIWSEVQSASAFLGTKVLYVTHVQGDTLVCHQIFNAGHVSATATLILVSLDHVTEKLASV